MQCELQGASTMRRLNRIVLVCLLIALFTLGAIAPAQARPFRGSVPWSVLLCKFSGSPDSTRSFDFYRDMFIRSGTGGLNDFWQATSYNGLNLNGSEVRGWYTIPSTAAQATAELARSDRDRGKYFRECIEAARTSRIIPYTVPSGNRVAVITEPGVDLWGGGGSAFLPSDVDLGAMGHEVGHGLGLNHSFSDDPTYRNASWSQIGEYDDQWDLMSYANVAAVNTGRFGFGGPRLNAYHSDRMGWMPMPRILSLGRNGVGSQTVTLAALSHPEASGYLQVRVPFDAADSFHYYTVELRRNDEWDGAFGRSLVLIHEIKPGSDGQYYSYLLRERSGDRNPLQSLNANGVSIAVNSISGNQASVTVSTNLVDRCLQGYVWREANSSDRVCVTPATRTQTRNDNAQAASRRTNGAYGPNTCIQGFVWREAFPGDQVCVTGEVRSQARADNQAAAERGNPARFVYGPNTCRAGLVWREADQSDYVCVNPAVRTQVRNDNAQAASRRTNGAYGPNTCIQGFVWREAFPGDQVCVTREVRSQTRADNQDAGNRLMKP
jgi:hypothetical protein